jgi:hypothetical protein
LLLSHYGIHHLLVEQRMGPKDHPQAHFICCRSMEIFRELGEVGRKIQHLSAPLDEWKRYIYCTNIAGLPGKPDNIGSQQNSILIEKSNSLANETEHSDSFRPQLIVGKRIPHFWLYTIDSPPGEKYSSLDLTSIITDEHKRPF